MKKQFFTSIGLSFFVVACSNVPYQQCDPRNLDTWGYFRCGDDNVRHYISDERERLSDLQHQRDNLLQQHNDNLAQKQQLQQQLALLKGQTLQIAQKMQYLQQLAARAQQLSTVQQEKLLQEIEQTMTEYERKADEMIRILQYAEKVELQHAKNVALQHGTQRKSQYTPMNPPSNNSNKNNSNSNSNDNNSSNNNYHIAPALREAKNVYDIADKIKTIKETKDKLQLVRRVMQGASLIRKLTYFSRLTIPGFIIGYISDKIIDGSFDYIEKLENE